MASNCQGLVESYVTWVRERLAAEQIDGVCEITTPFLDRHNDRLQIFVERRGDRLRLTDDGYIIGDLESSGCVLDTPHRQEALQTVLNGFGVREEDGELIVEASERDFPKKKHSLLQAMLAVNDMFVMARHKVSRLFLEDVSRFLEDHDVRYTPNIEFTGRSGFVHRYDFVIPRSKAQPERILRAINNPTRDAATSMIFSWTDTRDTRPRDSTAWAVLNDAEREPNPDVLSALSQYEITALPWSRREDYLEQLSA
jgi:hypothetical protein